MRILKLTFPILLLLAFSSFVSAPPKTFSIIIKQWGGMLSSNVITRVTQDSVVVNGTNYHNEEFGYENALLPTASKKIADALSKIDLDKLQSDYTNNNVDDAAEFDFSITMDGKKKDFHIYVTAVQEILDLVKEINHVLPKDMQVGYDENYLEVGK